MDKGIFILGAGISGLSAGINRDIPIYESTRMAGGICTSYYVSRSNQIFYSQRSTNAYRFEKGGGHWIFGADKKSKNFLNKLSPVKTYKRSSAVYLPDLNLYVPYPIQNHLLYLPRDIRERIAKEIIKSKDYKRISTLADWLKANFGTTLGQLFLFPFHNLYTAGLYTKIAPQDRYKTPVNKKLIIKGIREETPSAGYNVTFRYPKKGLDNLVMNMAKNCKIEFSKKVVKINLRNKEVFFEDGTSARYKKLVSTLPLNKMLCICGIKIDERPAPFTSVLVINIGAIKGKRCPPYHWVYTPKSKAGFHRVGFYSNVDEHFLPLTSKDRLQRVSIYVEKAYKDKKAPTKNDIKKISRDVIEELEEWKYIKKPEIVQPTWIETAYTWEYPNSKWRIKALSALKKYDIYQIGRYGKWKFQGIAESIRDGLEIGNEV